MFILQILDSGKLAVVTLRGPLTPGMGRTLSAELLRVMRCFDRIIVNAEQVTGMDASSFQRLCLAHRFAAALNKNLAIVGIRCEVVGQSTNDARFARCAACSGTGQDAGEKPSGNPASNPVIP